MFALAELIRRFLRLAITPIKTNQTPAAAEMDGALPNQGGLVGLFNNLITNAAPVFGNFGLGVYSGTTNTWLAADMLGGLIRRHGSQSSADLTDTAANIIVGIPGAVVNQTWPLFVANLTSGTMTPVAGTGVSLVGTTAIDRFSVRLYLGRVTGSAAVSLTSCFEFSGINAGQVATP